MESAVRMVRIYLHEADHGRRKSLMSELLTRLQQEGMRNATVFRAVAGTDGSGVFHVADLLRSVVNLPEAIEFFDTPERIEATLAGLADLLPAGHVVVWDARLR